MRRGMALLLLFMLCHQLVLKLGLLAWYQVNKDYIAQNFCENRDKPQLKCCGKCYLRKQLKKVDGSDNPIKNAALSFEKSEALACIIPSPLSLDLNHLEYPVAVVRTPVLQHLHHSSIPFPIFHPPAIAA